MTELSLGTGGDGNNSNGGNSGGGGGGGDIVETLEKMQDFLMENPQMAKAFGLDLGGLEDTMQDANETVDAGEQLDHNFLLNLLGGVEEAGFGEKSVSEVRAWVENNPEMVNNMIDENL